MQAEEALKRLLERFQRLEARLEGLERQLEEGEAAGEAAPEPEKGYVPAETVDELRADPFEPAVRRTSPAKHRKAVNKALSMLGLVPETDEESAERSRRATALHRETLDKALHVLGIAPESDEDRQARTGATAGYARALDKAREMLGKPAPAQASPAQASPAEPSPAEAIAREAAVPDLEEEDPAAPAEGAAPAATEAAPAASTEASPAVPEEAPDAGADPVPPPDLLPGAPKWEAAADAGGLDAIDLGDAVPVDLERPRVGVRDYAVPILNALVLLVAASAALYAGGVVTAEGFARDAWRELAVGGFAVLCGAASFFWRSASIHLRAFLAGSAALSLHLLVLVLLAPRLPLPAAAVLGACGLTSLLGAGLVLQARHPLALLLGFGVALAFPFWFVSQPELILPYAAAVNLATAVCAFRLHRLQASVAAAILTCVIVAGVRGPYALAYTAFFAATYAAQVLGWAFAHRKQSTAAALLTLPALGLAVWAVEGLYGGPGWIKAGVLFAIAVVTAVTAVRLPQRHALLRGVLKAGAMLLLLAALPVGLSATNLAPITLFLALAFGVFALSFYDDFLHAAGSLMLVATVVFFLRQPPSAAMLFAMSVVAVVLYAARGKGGRLPALALLMGAIAHGSLLYGVYRLASPELTVFVWLALALAEQAVARRFGLGLAEAGAVLAVGAAALWTAFLGPHDAATLALVAGGIVPHFLVARSRKTGGLLLLVAELLGLAAVAVALPGPVGVLASLPLLGLLVAPWPDRVRATLRGHARFVTLLLLARCFLPDVLGDVGAGAWLDLRAGAVAACFLAALVSVRFARSGRGLTALLASAVAGAAVHRATASPIAAAVAVAAALALCVVVARRGRNDLSG